MEDEIFKMLSFDICEFCGIECDELKDSLCEVCGSLPKQARDGSRTKGKEESDFDYYNKKKVLHSVIRIKRAIANKCRDEMIAYNCKSFLSLLETSKYDRGESFDHPVLDIEPALDAVLQSYRDGLDETALSTSFDSLRWSIKNSHLWRTVQRALNEGRIHAAKTARSFCVSCGQYEEDITMMGTCHACALVEDAIDKNLDLRKLFESEGQDDE